MTIELLLEKAESDFTPKNIRKWVAALPKHEPKKDILIEKSKLSDFSKEDFLEWVNKNEYFSDIEIATNEAKNVLKSKKGIPTVYKKGDTLMHPVFRHPYVLLEQKISGDWICGLLTTEEKCPEILEKANSRFFSDSYFTKVIFTVVKPIGTYMYPFDNNRQLNKVLKELKSIFV
jgi:hypothetical protein